MMSNFGLDSPPIGLHSAAVAGCAFYSLPQLCLIEVDALLIILISIIQQTCAIIVFIGVFWLF